MQRSWARDSNSAHLRGASVPGLLREVAFTACMVNGLALAECTFVILDRALPDTPGTGRHGGGACGADAFQVCTLAVLLQLTAGGLQETARPAPGSASLQRFPRFSQHLTRKLAWLC